MRVYTSYTCRHVLLSFASLITGRCRGPRSSGQAWTQRTEGTRRSSGSARQTRPIEHPGPHGISRCCGSTRPCWSARCQWRTWIKGSIRSTRKCCTFDITPFSYQIPKMCTLIVLSCIFHSLSPPPHLSSSHLHLPIHHPHISTSPSIILTSPPPLFSHLHLYIPHHLHITHHLHILHPSSSRICIISTIPFWGGGVLDSYVYPHPITGQQRSQRTTGPNWTSGITCECPPDPTV